MVQPRPHSLGQNFSYLQPFDRNNVLALGTCSSRNFSYLQPFDRNNVLALGTCSSRIIREFIDNPLLRYCSKSHRFITNCDKVSIGWIQLELIKDVVIFTAAFSPTLSFFLYIAEFFRHLVIQKFITMSAGSSRGSHPDNVSSSIWGSEWSHYVRPEFRRQVEIEWRMMRLRDLEMERQNMQSRNHLVSTSSLGHFNSIQQPNISSLGKRIAQVDEVGIQHRPNLKELIEMEHAKVIQNARDKHMEAARSAHFKRQQEVNGTTREVDLTLRMWFKEEDYMNEPNKRPRNG